MIIKMKIILVFFAIISTPVVANAASGSEDAPYSGITIFLGPSASYFQGKYSDSFESFDYDRINFQLNSFWGYVSPRSRGRNAVGLFVTGGYTNKTTFNQMLDLQGIETDPLVINKFFTFYQVELGMVVSNVIRLSTGYGRQNYTTVNGDSRFNYLSSTAGLLIDFGSLYWNIDANFKYERDFPNSLIHLSTGFMLKF
jgi:hypothetical protein